MFRAGDLQTWSGYGVNSVLNFLSGIKKTLFKKEHYSKIFAPNTAYFEDALVSTAVIEAAEKSLKNKSKWKKIKI